MSYNTAMARKIASRHKVQADSLAEIKRGLRAEADRLSDEGVGVDGHSVWPGNLLNAVVCWYLSQGADERLRIAREGLGIFTEHLDSEQPTPFDTPVATNMSVAGHSVDPTTGESLDQIKPQRQKDTA